MQSQVKFENISAEGYRFAIIVARWNGELTAKLARGALDALSKAGANKDEIEIFNVPGAFELPVAAMKAP